MRHNDGHCQLLKVEFIYFQLQVYGFLSLSNFPTLCDRWAPLKLIGLLSNNNTMHAVVPTGISLRGPTKIFKEEMVNPLTNDTLLIRITHIFLSA